MKRVNLYSSHIESEVGLNMRAHGAGRSIRPPTAS
jgi:hypothetical protein